MALNDMCASTMTRRRQFLWMAIDDRGRCLLWRPPKRAVVCRRLSLPSRSHRQLPSRALHLPTMSIHDHRRRLQLLNIVHTLDLFAHRKRSSPPPVVSLTLHDPHCLPSTISMPHEMCTRRVACSRLVSLNFESPLTTRNKLHMSRRLNTPTISLMSWMMNFK